MNASLRRPLGLALVLASVAGALAACQIVAGLEMPSLVEPEATNEAGTPPGGVDACAPRVPLPRPSQPGPDIPVVTFAAEFFDLPTTAQGDRGRLCPSAALDIDGFATCEEVAQPDGTVVLAGGSCLSLTTSCDVQGGGDSNLGLVATANLGTEPSPENDPNLQLRRGQLGVLMEIANYNGLEDDGQVSLVLAQAVGVILPDGGFPSPTKGGPEPTFRPGEDTWVPEARSFPRGEDRPAALINDAYVTGDILVGRFATRTALSLGGAAGNLEADEIVITARIVRGADGLPERLDQGRIALRVPGRTLFDYAAGRLSEGISVCSDAGVADTLRSLIARDVCEALDLAEGAGAVTPGELCSAISFGAGFYAVRAKRSILALDAGLSPPTPPCPPGIPWPPRCADFLDGGR